MSYQKLFEPTISSESVKAWKAEGKKAMGYVCCHVPEEIFYAADVLPVRLRATGCVDNSDAEVWMSSFSCSYARSIWAIFYPAICGALIREPPQPGGSLISAEYP